MGVILVLAFLTGAAPPVKDDLVRKLREMAEEKGDGDPVTAAREDLRKQIRAANDRENKAWRAVSSKAEWEKFRDVRIAALRKSLGRFPVPPRDLKVRIRKTLDGDGYRIDNLTFESRPGLLVTANLYRPAKQGQAMPGILIVHSHHHPKTQGELQDMGVMWAKAGCLVLVMDQLGHGERRQHPFRTKEDHPKPYRISRQDYFFRYNTGMQLETIGDSLMSWMVWDIQRGIDLLLSRPGIDKSKIILLGAVAGGGDPAAVVSALDKRVAAVVPFNFGRAEVTKRDSSLPDPEARFNFAGTGGWESTRNLADSTRDGFFPWVIDAASAPRRLIYAHEFAWDKDNDPVWKRLQKVYAWYGHPEYLSSLHGSGQVSGKPPEATHCNNIGAVHRKGIHPALKEWFGIPLPREKQERRPTADLLCLNKGEQLPPMHRLATAIAEERIAAARKRRSDLGQAEFRRELRREWARILGDVEPARITRHREGLQRAIGEGVLRSIERITSDTSKVRVVYLIPKHIHGARLPVVVVFGQGGPAGFLRYRSGEIAALLRGRSVVALVSLEDQSNLLPGSGRGRVGPSTWLASTRLMLGQPTLGVQLRGLRTALAGVRQAEGIDPRRITLWGDSFAPINPPGTPGVPLEFPQPAQAEPLGGLLALLGALFEDGIVSVRARGGLIGWKSLLESPFCHVPYDAIVPGALTTGDLADVVAALAPMPVRLEAMVDGRNRLVGQKECERVYAPARAAYGRAKATEKLRITR
jgi:dienelactone hydrolase